MIEAMVNEQDSNNHLIIYQDDKESVNVNVRFADEDVWLTQGQLAEIYDTTQHNIALHISRTSMPTMS
jgi:toxin-antitoxin system, toxin component, fic family